MKAQQKGFCLLCNGENFSEFSQFALLKAVTSDCRPWDRGSLLKVCLECGHVQKSLDALWEKDVTQIYSEYTMYPLSEGREQVVFKDFSPRSSPRSLQILTKLGESVELPRQGRLLDVGCGNGEFLRYFGEKYPGWSLAGYEQDGRYREEVMQIAGVEQFCSQKFDEIEGRFNLITLIHVLEHLPMPLQALKQLRQKLVSNGLLFIHIPNCLCNPFDLMVKDHCSHFTLDSAVQLARQGGFTIDVAATNWVSNYISLVLRVSPSESPLDLEKVEVEAIVKEIRRRISWLEQVVSHAQHLAMEVNLGVFGTAIAGSWLAGTLGSHVRFFVDEDSLRINKLYLGLKVFHPQDVPPDSYVYLAFAPEMANQICRRLQKLYTALNLIRPPDFVTENAVNAH